jgi:hypothetical protein
MSKPMRSEPEVVEVGCVYVDCEPSNMFPLPGDLHALIIEIDRLMSKFRLTHERMRISIQSELVHTVHLGDK